MWLWVIHQDREMANSQLCGLSSCRLCCLASRGFQMSHRGKYWGKGGRDKHQPQFWPHRHARPSLLPFMHPPQHGRKHRGGRGGTGHWLRSRLHGYSISILLHVQALNNKLDGLRARISFQWDIRSCNIVCFTETWLSPGIKDNAIQPGGMTMPFNHHQRFFAIVQLVGTRRQAVIKKKILDTTGQHWEAQEELLSLGHEDPKWGHCSRNCPKTIFTYFIIQSYLL